MKRILIYDRDSANASYVREALCFLGFDARACLTPEHTLATADGFLPHSVIASLSGCLDEHRLIAAQLRGSPAMAHSNLICLCREPGAGTPRERGFDHQLGQPAPLYDLVRLLL